MSAFSTTVRKWKHIICLILSGSFTQHVIIHSLWVPIAHDYYIEHYMNYFLCYNLFFHSPVEKQSLCFQFWARTHKIAL